MSRNNLNDDTYKNNKEESPIGEDSYELNVEELIATIRYKIQRTLERKAEKPTPRNE